MIDYDLEALSLTELRKLDKDVAKAISTFEGRQKADARAKVEAFCKEMGYSLAELVGHDAKPKRIPAVPKYQHPEPAIFTEPRFWLRAGRFRWLRPLALRLGVNVDGTTMAGLTWDLRFGERLFRAPYTKRCEG